MNVSDSTVFQKYFLPGFIFQSVIIAGGYGTGREIVEYFLRFGPLGGLLGMLVTTALWSLLLALIFEFARIFRAFDYRTFFRALLGRYWFLFEIVYLLYLLIVLAVIGSAAGILLRDNFGLPYLSGVIVMFVVVGYLTFRGSRLIERFLSFWSFLLYGVYAALLIAALVKFGPDIQDQLRQGVVRNGWPMGAVKYAVYNLGNIAAVFFCLHHIESRKEAVTAGLLAGLIGILPGCLFYISVCGLHPAILTEEIPAVFLLQKAGVSVILIAFQIILFGTLIESGTAFIHSVNERIHSVLRTRGKSMRAWHRSAVAVGMLLVAVSFSTVGIIGLIAGGYGAASWAFLAIFILPLLMTGFVKIRNASGSQVAPGKETR